MSKEKHSSIILATAACNYVVRCTNAGRTFLSLQMEGLPLRLHDVNGGVLDPRPLIKSVLCVPPVD